MSAKNDSSKKPEHFQQIRRKRVGAVAVIEMEDVKSKLRYFRTECKRKNVTPRTKGHPTWEEAMLFASKQNIAVETGQIKVTDDETIFKLKQLGEKINVSNKLFIFLFFCFVFLFFYFFFLFSAILTTGARPPNVWHHRGR